MAAAANRVVGRRARLAHGVAEQAVVLEVGREPQGHCFRHVPLWRYGWLAAHTRQSPLVGPTQVEQEGGMCGRCGPCRGRCRAGTPRRRGRRAARTATPRMVTRGTASAAGRCSADSSIARLAPAVGVHVLIIGASTAQADLSEAPSAQSDRRRASAASGRRTGPRRAPRTRGTRRHDALPARAVVAGRALERHDVCSSSGLRPGAHRWRSRVGGTTCSSASRVRCTSCMRASTARRRADCWPTSRGAFGAATALGRHKEWEAAHEGAARALLGAGPAAEAGLVARLARAVGRRTRRRRS